MGTFPEPQRNQPQFPESPFFWTLVVILVIAVAITLYLIFSMITSTMNQALNPAYEDPLIVESDTNEINPEELENLDFSLQHRNGPEYQPWDGKSRVTILLLGVDDRSWELGNGPPRTDTMILVTINPENHTAGMMSLPRDLWVDVPGNGFRKINQAFPLGEAQGYSTGGAGLAMATVEQFLDVDIPYYIQINFDAFTNLIDEIGGVKINVPETIIIDPLGDGNTRNLQPGVQTLPGDLTLAYVRNRDTAGGDFDRASRQQQVIIGVIKRLTDFNLLPTLVRKAPALYQNVSAGINTNLTIQQIVKLGQLAYNIPEANIQHVVIGLEHVTAAQSYEGAYILNPIPGEIEALKTIIFSTQPSLITVTPTDTASVSPTAIIPTATLTAEAEEPTQERLPTVTVTIAGPSVAVHNGTGETGLAADTADYLRRNGINVTEVGNASEPYTHTTIIDYTGNPDIINQLSQLLEIPYPKIYSQHNPNNAVDVLLILGDDLKAPP